MKVSPKVVHQKKLHFCLAKWMLFFGAFFPFWESALATPHVGSKKAQGQGLWILRQVSPKVAHKKMHFCLAKWVFFLGSNLFSLLGVGPWPPHIMQGWPWLAGAGGGRGGGPQEGGGAEKQKVAFLIKILIWE